MSTPNAPTPSLEEVVTQHVAAYFMAHLPDLPPAGVMERILPLMERPLIVQCLRATGGNRIQAAELLGINRNTLRKRMKELGIT